MRKIIILTTLLLAAITAAGAESFKFDLSGTKNPEKGFTAIGAESVFSPETGFGYDFGTSYDNRGRRPFFFSVIVPDGNYRVTVTLGSNRDDGHTTVRGEARRMYLHNIATAKGEFVTRTFVVNKHNPVIKGRERVKIKEREKSGMNWDDKLTLEFNGDMPRVQKIEIEPADDDVVTLFLCGDSTVVDNDSEPYTGWGQMLPMFFNDRVCVANYAESGLSANTFLGGRRLEKALTQMKKGDVVLVEFGHNDQKQRGSGIGAYYSFTYYIKQFIDEVRLKGATPVLVTPTRRRQLDSKGKIRDTHADYPAAMRDIAAREGLVLIDFQQMTGVMIEAAGDEASKRMYVHYPAGTFEGQERELKDNSHFSNFGAYEVSKCFISALLKTGLPLAGHVSDAYTPFDPAQPDRFADFKYNASPFVLTAKPAGN